MASKSHTIPSSILIIGSGVFGLSTAYALARRSEYKNTSITVLDRLPFPAPDAASIDTSRLVRADYADFAYSALAAEALEIWRGEFGAEGRYNQSGLVVLTEKDSEGHAGAIGDESLDSVQRLGLKVGRKEDGGQVTVLENEEDVRRVMPGFSGVAGQHGYVNWTSGWADAEAGVRHMRKKVEELQRVTFKIAEVKKLLFVLDGGQRNVVGVELASGEKITADLTLLATGAWSGKFVDLRGVATATGHTLAYVDVTGEEQEKLLENPAVLNADNFMYVIPPRNNVLKIARHGYGYANPQEIPHPERPESGETITVSLPRTKHDDANLSIAPEGEAECRAYLARCVPELKDRPFVSSRICWYSDTPGGDWLIDYHPQYKGLFVAVGGSGHAYKFLPVIGERVVDVLSDLPRDSLGDELRQKWRWPRQKEADDFWSNEWRGGPRGMILDDELGKAQAEGGHK